MALMAVWPMRLLAYRLSTMPLIEVMISSSTWYGRSLKNSPDSSLYSEEFAFVPGLDLMIVIPPCN